MNFIIQNISLFDFFLLITLLTITITSRIIIDFLDTSDLEKRNLNSDDLKNRDKKHKLLRSISLFIIFLYLATFYIKNNFLSWIIDLLFIWILIYLIDSFIKRRILITYWTEIEISWDKYIQKWYKTQIFSLITTIISSLTLIYFIFKIFWIDSILEWGWIIAWILAFLGFTAPVWAPDLVASIMILHNWEIEVWNTIRIKDKNILARVKNINLSEVKLIDLVYWNPIIIRPSKFRDDIIENLSNWVMWKRSLLLQTIEIKVWYEVKKEDLEDLVFKAFDELVKNYPIWTIERKYFPDDIKRFLEIDNFWDDSTNYKFWYYISSPFYIVKASRLLNKYLQKYQNEKNIYFSTPKLISIR